MSKKWDDRYSLIAGQIAEWSSCRRRKVGAVIVKDNRIVATGYNGAPSGVESCVSRGYCVREQQGIPSGQRHELCYAVHAEQNAIAQAAKLGASIDGATLYCTHQPCVLCAKLMVNAGIRRVVFQQGYPDAFALEILKDGGIKIDGGEKVEA